MMRALLTFATVIGLVAAHPASAQPSSYPKLYVDGPGLAITRFLLEKKAGSDWVAAPSYRPQEQYRLKMRLTNYYRDTEPFAGRAFAEAGIHITHVVVKMKVAFAKFNNTGRSDGHAFLMPGMVNDHPDFNDTIAPAKSRWFTFGHFTWIGPPAALSLYPVEISTSHRGIFYMPGAPWARLNPNQ